MPRYLRNTRLSVKTAIREKQAKKTRVRFGQFIDPFPWVEGTLPEKMVYAELSRRGIPFGFQDEVTFNIPDLDAPKDYRPDIIIPSLRLIIEVQGSYWHSTDKAIEDDSFKFAYYQMAGWRVLAWWDYDISARLQDLFAQDPQLSGYGPLPGITSTSEIVVQRKIYRDDSKGIVTLNRKRAARNAYKKAAPRLRLR